MPPGFGGSSVGRAELSQDGSNRLELVSGAAQEEESKLVAHRSLKTKKLKKYF